MCNVESVTVKHDGEVWLVLELRPRWEDDVLVVGIIGATPDAMTFEEELRWPAVSIQQQLPFP